MQLCLRHSLLSRVRVVCKRRDGPCVSAPRNLLRFNADAFVEFRDRLFSRSELIRNDSVPRVLFYCADEPSASCLKALWDETPPYKRG